MSEKSLLHLIQEQINSSHRSLSFFKSDMRMMEDKVKRLEIRVKELEDIIKSYRLGKKEE